MIPFLADIMYRIEELIEVKEGNSSGNTDLMGVSLHSRISLGSHSYLKHCPEPPHPHAKTSPFSPVVVLIPG